jgi:transposase
VFAQTEQRLGIHSSLRDRAPSMNHHSRPNATGFCGSPADAVLADKAYDSNDLRDQIAEMEAQAVIPSKRNRKVFIPHDTPSDQAGARMAYGLQRAGRDRGGYAALAALPWLGGEYRAAKLVLARKSGAQDDGRADTMGRGHSLNAHC